MDDAVPFPPSLHNLYRLDILGSNHLYPSKRIKLTSQNPDPIVSSNYTWHNNDKYLANQAEEKSGTGTIMAADPITITESDKYQAILRPLIFERYTVLKSAQDTLERHDIPITAILGRSAFSFTAPRGQEVPLTSHYWQSVIDLRIVDGDTGQVRHVFEPSWEEVTALRRWRERREKRPFELANLLEKTDQMETNMLAPLPLKSIESVNMVANGEAHVDGDAGA